MRKFITYIAFTITATVLVVSFSSCSRKTGCKTSENVTVKTNRKGQLPSKRGKSNLFPKEMRKKKKKSK